MTSTTTSASTETTTATAMATSTSSDTTTATPAATSTLTETITVTTTPASTSTSTEKTTTTPAAASALADVEIIPMVAAAALPPVTATLTTTTTTTTTTTRDPAGVVADSEWEHFKLVNELRANGFTCPGGSVYAPNPVPMKFDCKLWKVARLHSLDMADHDYFSHTSEGGQTPWQRAEAEGTCAVGENIGAGSGDPAAILETWKSSDGHCKNMMNAGATVFAVGWDSNPSSSYTDYWTQMQGCAEEPEDTSC